MNNSTGFLKLQVFFYIHFNFLIFPLILSRNHAFQYLFLVFTPFQSHQKFPFVKYYFFNKSANNKNDKILSANGGALFRQYHLRRSKL